MMLTKNKIKNSGLYVFMFIISLVYLITGINLGQPIVEGAIEPSFFPIILGSCSVTFSSILLYFNLSEKTVDTSVREKSQKTVMHSVSALVIVTAIYIGLFTTIGYILSSILYVFATIVLFSDKKKLLQKFFISLTIVIIGYLIFEQLFGVRLPTFEV